ncbi:GlxA family transcriptional regulator [Kitasatospora sp. A2-31]|uniref:GlxA family transcriptional regulator n=1 Tax=Kitasatospora sp. A2-31 TaxID=2916414 RepID=UPI001EED5FBB|nr:helix-turn-helix domain-containing protein [Kitasatospora sp. A2-31]MCG6499853.1 helix-turn-helix domain-containing protein [Kitasatospora sp. A2-31]MCG6499923.1 helix-turn-helix domain-containing protein [Kitasatospora sp. A2-31]
MSVVEGHRVAVLALPGVLPLDLGIAVQTFGSDPHYQVTVCTDPSAGPVCSGGFTVGTSAGLEALRDADTVVVPGYLVPDAPVPAASLSALRSAHARGARMVSICTGAFALAAAGLLDGRPATTHWQDAAALQRLYPRIEVRPNQLYVDDGDVLTSAGVTAGVDLCLHVIRRDYGAAAANARARSLVAPPQRPGGQAQFVERFRPASRGEDLAPVRAWMLDNLAQRQSVDELAQRAHMSRRTFIRRFQQETGTSPMAWLTAARIDRARELLETTTTPVEQVARLSGLGSPAAFRATFHRYVDTSPAGYRATFRAGPAANRR